MIYIEPQVFDVSKAIQLLDFYDEKRELLKTLFLFDLIEQQDFKSPKSILYRDVMVKKRYKKELIESVLYDMGYELVFFKSYKEFGLKSKFSVIAFGLGSTEG